MWTKLIKKIERFLGRLKGQVQVYALVGSSGTGKSFRARIIADRLKIRFIIDDGILIKDKRILAGHSAKRESAYLAAVKVAIFADNVHRHEVAQALERNRCKRLLILGTSDRMILKICQSLGLPEPVKLLSISDFASADEIQTALDNRKLYGRHVIPVPAREVRRTAAHIVTDEIKLWSQNRLLQREKIYEKTLVRPEFSSGEALEIPEHLLKQAIRTTLDATTPGSKLGYFRPEFEEGYSIKLTIWLGDGFFPSPQLTETLRIQLGNQLKKQTGAFIKEIDLTLRELRPLRR